MRNLIASLSFFLVGAVALTACQKKHTPPPPAVTPVVTNTRCPVDLSPWMSGASASGASAGAHVITSPADLIGGESARGNVGDTLLSNDKIRVIIQAPGRHVGPDPYGGEIIDADFVGTPGNDQFGKLGLFFDFGRTVDVMTLEILTDGGSGPAIVAATGPDTVNNYINIKNVLNQYLPAGSQLRSDPDTALNLNVTTYYILQPGQTHVTLVSAFCNAGQNEVSMAAGDLIEHGGNVALFTPQAASGGFGYTSSPDPMRYVAFEANDSTIAYGVAPYAIDDLSTPEVHSNSLTIAGVTGYIVGLDPGLQGLSEWLSGGRVNPSGQMIVPPMGSAVLGREFVVGHDLGEVTSTIETVRAAKTQQALGQISGSVSDSLGPVASARVVVECADPDHYEPTMRETVFVTDANGKFAGTLPAQSYTLTAYAPGRLPGSPITAVIPSGGSAPVSSLSVGDTRQLTVKIEDTAGNPLPGKVTVLCNGLCPARPSSLVRWEDTVFDAVPDDVQLTATVTPSGTATLEVPPGQYQVIVSHGPEYSLYPLTAPAQGLAIDTTSAGAPTQIVAKLTKVVDTTGWLSADFHIHTVNSPDSRIPVVDRVKTFLAEGVNVMTSTDHDFITDYAPTNATLGGTGQMATIIGEEITTFDYGHFNPWPLVQDPTDPVTYGAFDWGRENGPNKSIDEIIAGARALGATTFQINHAGGSSSTFGGLLLDSATLATHAEAATFRLAPSPYATADDTGLFPRTRWDAMEIMNGFSHDSFHGMLNDWMTFMSNGLVVTGTAVSDTHKRWSVAAGYPRSYVRTTQTVGTLDPAQFSQEVNGQRVQGALGLFVKMYAFKAGTAPTLTSAIDSNLEVECAKAGCGQVGDTLSVGTSAVDVILDVQAPDWVSFDTLVVMNHQAARAMTDGNPVNDFAPGTQTPGAWSSAVTLDPAGPSHEVVLVNTDGSMGCGQAPCSVGRWHVQQVFHLPASPGTADDFIFAAAFDSKTSGNGLMPLVYDGVVTDPSSGAAMVSPAYAFTFTNAVILDTDGNGYDHPPGTAKPVGSGSHHPHTHGSFPTVQTAMARMLSDLVLEKE